MDLTEIGVGDIVERTMAGVKMKLKVSKVIGNMIYCGPWKFSMKNGAEIDEDLGWNEFVSGSVIKMLD